MLNDLRHFAINADDPNRAMDFYRRVFGWRFEAWGPPGFYTIHTGDHAPVLGALQQRRQLISGTKTVGLEGTFAVESVAETARLVVASGGKIAMAKSTIAGVGDLIFIEDTEGNALGAMRYDPSAR